MKIKEIFIFCILCCSFTSCFQRKEGCLDILSSNYDVEALDPCEDCCTYPNLILQISNMVGDSILNISDTLTNKLGQQLTIFEVRFYISEITLYNDTDSVQVNSFITSAATNERIRNDIKIARSNTNEINIGEYPVYGRFDKVKLKVGLDKSILQDTFINLATDHVLNAQNKIKLVNGNPAMFRLRYRLIDSDTDKFVWLENLPENIILTLQQNVTTRRGENIRFNAKFDYLPLIDDIDFTQPDSVIQKALFDKVPEIFK